MTMDDGGEQVEPGHSVVLALARAVADFALTPDAERVLERVMSLALVQAGVGPARNIGVEQPVDDEERAFDPSDFSESDSQFVLARIGDELSQMEIAVFDSNPVRSTGGPPLLRHYVPLSRHH